ncbi:hypothetical protein LEP1GSC195_0764 [Leptospira wolbachii serovar Codice str. CDC]|uniref:Uncharacterized protein n=1 Tax=Leptospira wolbachii serovar Codice str. CDC TaxID=1218599 RepID=R8ZYE0_9LEPT|nr:hypothetical protein [Leptospira wolbachii]EOQ94973.1 hypothetical protein LEP1GSC195_0764 [Leptospira wolbachii serovar Codice str. CDC]
MKKFFLFSLSFLLFHCANTSYFQTWGKHKVRLNGYTTAEGYTVADSFDLTYTRVYLFWGLSNIRDKALDELLAEVYLKHPNAQIGDLKITEEYEFWDGVFDMITFGIVRPYTLNLKGNIYAMTNGGISK